MLGQALLPEHLRAQVRRELDRLELLLAQIKVVEAERASSLVALIRTHVLGAPRIHGDDTTVPVLVNSRAIALRGGFRVQS